MIMIYKALCEHFGLSPQYDVAGFLPAPDVPRLEMSADEAADEELLTQAVREVYNIERDDGNLRLIANEPAEARGCFFDALRKNYPVRREFHNTTIMLSAGREILARKLQGIGFRVEEEGQE
jgi:erythronate-4-phosphate dehydrogenase